MSVRRHSPFSTRKIYTSPALRPAPLPPVNDVPIGSTPMVQGEGERWYCRRFSSNAYRLVQVCARRTGDAELIKRTWMWCCADPLASLDAASWGMSHTGRLQFAVGLYWGLFQNPSISPRVPLPSVQGVTQSTLPIITVFAIPLCQSCGSIVEVILSASPSLSVPRVETFPRCAASGRLYPAHNAMHLATLFGGRGSARS
ncbi:hypothetical protein H4582DRAFT_1965844 [Lactarius indigo]|nr:hypothetical protein H4582DRAFT_1965844 [Lactarius indigo]